MVDASPVHAFSQAAGGDPSEDGHWRSACNICQYSSSFGEVSGLLNSLVIVACHDRRPSLHAQHETYRSRVSFFTRNWLAIV